MALLLTLAVILSFTRASAQPVTIEGATVEVTGDGMTTVVGEASSLRAIVEELCRQAGVELRAYNAPDRRYAGSLENVPLDTALRSMLRLESYLLGVREAQPSGRRLVTWLRVLGRAERSAQAVVPGQGFATPRPKPTAVPPPQAPKFRLSSSLLFQAFGTFDPQRRDRAQREILSRLNDATQRNLFLESAPEELATLFNRYRNATNTLRRLKSLSTDADVRRKLDEIIAVLGD